METRDVRDKILTLLRNNFDSTELTMIDSAIEEVIGSLNITEQETSIIAANSCMPDVLNYLVRKKAKGLSEGTLEQYSLTLKAFCLGVPKALPDITEWDILNFLDDYERRRHINKRRKDTMRVILNGFFRYMADCGRIKSNPMATIEPIKYQKNVRQPLTDMELEKLRYACTKKKGACITRVLLCNGV